MWTAVTHQNSDISVQAPARHLSLSLMEGILPKASCYSESVGIRFGIVLPPSLPQPHLVALVIVVRVHVRVRVRALARLTSVARHHVVVRHGWRRRAGGAPRYRHVPGSYLRSHRMTGGPQRTHVHVRNAHAVLEVASRLWGRKREQRMRVRVSVRDMQREA
jgi:hypothetical protein